LLSRHAPGHRNGVAEHWHDVSSPPDAAPDRRDDTAEHRNVASSSRDADTCAVSDRADVAEHGQRPLLSDVDSEAVSDRSDIRLYDPAPPLAPTKKAEEVDAAVTRHTGSPGTLKTWMASLSLEVEAGPAKVSIATADLGGLVNTRVGFVPVGVVSKRSLCPL
jgi:hypothetical protein